MWCIVQQCRGSNGERLPRASWSEAVEGDLSIYLGRNSFVATLDRLDIDQRRQVLYPLFDVRVQTLEGGLLVVGYRINAESRPVRETRQAWFCVPAAPPVPINAANAPRGANPPAFPDQRRRA